MVIIKKLAHLPLLIGGVLLLVLQWHNVTYFPETKGFDAGGHIEYITLLKERLRVPLANEGWELYQPPLYYLVAALLPSLTAVQWLGFFGWVIFGVVGYLVYRRHFDSLLALTGSSLVMALPVIIYLSPTISNELFAAVLINGTLAYYLLARQTSLRFFLILGILLGLTLLSKATGVIALLAILFNELWRYRQNSSRLKLFGITLVVAVIIGGWFYLRNGLYFGNPFVSSVDFAQYQITQPPGYRDLRFLVDLSGFLKLDLFHAHWYSLIPGTYFSYFYDGHNVIIPVQGFSKVGALLVLSSLPISLLAFVGVYRGSGFRTKEGKVFLTYLFLLFLGYVAYNFKLPFYSTVKGSFLVSSAVPFVYFVLKGVRLLRIPRWVTGWYLLGYLILIVKNFWIMGWWY